MDEHFLGECFGSSCGFAGGVLNTHGYSTFIQSYGEGKIMIVIRLWVTSLALGGVLGIIIWGTLVVLYCMCGAGA